MDEFETNTTLSVPKIGNEDDLFDHHRGQAVPAGRHTSIAQIRKKSLQRLTMNQKEPSEEQEITRTGRRFDSVAEMLLGTGSSKEIAEGYDKVRKKTRISRNLAELRCEAGLSQKEMAEKIGCTQSRISKIENALDSQVSLEDIHDYSRATKVLIHMVFGPKMNLSKLVKYHALEMRTALKELATLAHKDEEFDKAINGFFTEAFVNLLDIMDECRSELPKAGSKIDFKALPFLQGASVEEAGPNPRKMRTVANAERKICEV